MDAEITCVIPSFNQGAFLEEAIISVLNQEGVSIELILMDGGSEDGSLDIIKKYENYFDFWRSFHDRGQAAAINEGVAKGSGKYVCWLNSDDRLAENAFKQQIDFFRTNPGVVAVHGKGANIDVAGNRLSIYPSMDVNYETLLRNCPICQPTVMMTRNVWEAVGGLDCSFEVCLDYDLWWRIYRLGAFGFIDSILAETRIHGETKTAKMRKRHYREAYRILRREHGRVPLKWWITGFFEERYGCFPKHSNFWQKLEAVFRLPGYYREINREEV